MSKLIQILDADRDLLAAISMTMTEAARRSGDWLVCRPGCTQCCHGPFAITALDAMRLRSGLAALDLADPKRGHLVRERAAAYVASIVSIYPGDPNTGELRDEDALPDVLDEVACPALDPETGHCDLYAARPLTCRTFGPVTRTLDDNLAACELCYTGATHEEMARCAVDFDPDGREAELLAALADAGTQGMTIIAYALASGSPPSSTIPAPVNETF